MVIKVKLERIRTQVSYVKERSADTMPKSITRHTEFLNKYEKLIEENRSTEEWKPIMFNGKETMYMISNHGEVRNREGRTIRPFHSFRVRTKRPTYLRVNLYLYDDDGNRYTKKFSIHRLVAMAFIPNPENKPEVNHKDGKIYNNFDDNLEWCTNLENIGHAIRMSLRHPRKGSDHPNTSNVEHDVRIICQAIENGWSVNYAFTECSEEMIHPMEYPMFRNLFFNVKQHKSWNHVSKDYAF